VAFSHWCREEETHCSNTSTPVKSDKELQTEKGEHKLTPVLCGVGWASVYTSSGVGHLLGLQVELA